MFFSQNSSKSSSLSLSRPFSISTYHRDDGQYYYCLPTYARVNIHIIFMYTDYGRKTEDTIADPKCILHTRPRRPHRPNTEKYVYRARPCRRKRAGGDVAVCGTRERGEPTGRRRRCCSARQRRQTARASRDSRRRRPPLYNGGGGTRGGRVVCPGNDFERVLSPIIILRFYVSTILYILAFFFSS